MYDSPIDLYIGDIHHQIMEQQENEIYKAVLHYVPDVDKAELIRALQYDREQYDKGYADGKRDAMSELVRCKDCKYIRPEVNAYTQEVIGHWCSLLDLGSIEDEHFCSYGERKDGEG